MPFQELPAEVREMLAKYAASPRLVAHLTVVYDVAVALVKQLSIIWPSLVYDQESVLLGAATHDIGKIRYPNELTGPGDQHEEIGPQMLRENGFPEKHARFARTHARWDRETPVKLEDTLVAFADTIWKGQRNNDLEQEITQQIASQIQEEAWNVYMKLDDLTSELEKGAHERILWQGKYPV
ncbi:MAG TPA: HD domain-containing protein [Ktedonobacteraceae bacterium]|nr:HD domain-containing protein [Ktedonobacteraceae bacterium]